MRRPQIHPARVLAEPTVDQRFAPGIGQNVGLDRLRRGEFHQSAQCRVVDQERLPGERGLEKIWVIRAVPKNA